MFRKLSIIGSLFTCIFVGTIAADECDGCALSIEGQAGYFIFADNTMRDIYDNGGFKVALSATYPLQDIWNLYASLGFIEAWGKSLHFKERTSFWQIPLDIGIKPVICLCSDVDWYLAVGPRFFYAHQRNHSDYVSKNIGKSGVGVFVNTGFDFYRTCDFNFNVFGEYAYQSIRPSSSKHGTHRKCIEIGGFAIGGGVGYTF